MRHPEPVRIRPLGLLLVGSALAPTAAAQVTYSISTNGRTTGVADAANNQQITAGDILTPPGGVPRFPQGTGTFFRPAILVGGGVSSQHGIISPGLSVGTHDSCIGTGPGELCFFELDALSYGEDAMASSLPGLLAAAGPKAQWAFSVDEHARGDLAATTQAPNVLSESPAGDAAADIFMDLGLFAVPPIGPPVGPGAAIGLYDGDGLRSTSTLFAYPGLGLDEPVPPAPGLEDNLDAFDLDGEGFPMVSFPIYFSLDSAFWDPKEGAFNSGTAAANGFVGGDVLVVPFMGAAPLLYASAATLGLDQTGADKDDLDALSLLENGIAGYQPSLTPYDWELGSTDMLFFSVRRNSAIVGAIDSILGLPIEESDVLVPPVMGGNGNSGIFIAGENFGLRTFRTHFDPCGDDLDALDHIDTRVLLAQEYCYGDGGLFAGCTNCPCGNNAPPNSPTGCLNSTGSGARIVASGFANVSGDTLRFEVVGATLSTFGVLASGTTRLPVAGACLPGSGVASALLDGLRCVGGSVLRHGARPTNGVGSIGDTTAGWGPPNGPPGGLLANNAWVACTTRQFMVFYRESILLGCMRGQNTTNAVQVTFLP